MRWRKLSCLLASIRGIDRLLDPVRRAFAKTGGLVLITDFDHDLNFYVRLNEHMGSQIFWYGAYSPGSLKVLSRLMQKDSVFVDVGANDGEFTCFAAKRCARVIAIEPVNQIFQRLSSNVRVNGFKNVELLCAAVGNRKEKLKIFSRESLFLDGTQHTGLSTFHPYGDRQTALQDVDVFPLDELLDQKQRVDIIKIDVEGHELSVLEGARRLIDTCRPSLLIEFADEPLKAAGTSLSELFRYVVAKGYQAQMIDHQGRLAPIKETDLTSFQNILFTQSHQK